MFGGGANGMPVTVPCDWMLKALATIRAATLRLPEVRMPAAPASTVPRGATRLALPTGTPGSDCSVAMPAPDTAPLMSAAQIQSRSQEYFGGGADTEVLAPLPASRLPFELHIRMSPPCSVITRLCATSTS